jgi:nanoRNase/pAp phosphatase (c-di-AMP/oligoRNAs hydrolase)
MARPTASARLVDRDTARLLRFLHEHRRRIRRLLILTHDYPDPDSIASGFALKHIAEHRFRIPSKLAYGGVIGRPENREMVSHLKVPIHPLKRGDLAAYPDIALVDTQPEFKNNPFPPGRRATLVIDQHASLFRPMAQLSIINTECGATSVILARALLNLKIPIPSPLATALAYGILSDTLNLYRTNDPVVITTYTQLIPYCDLKALARIQNPGRSRRFFQTVGHGIREALVCRDLIVSHLRFVENPDVVSQTADFFLTYRRMEWSFSTGRYNGRLYMSLRTEKDDVEAGEILRDICGNRANAGGHGGVAGGSFEMTRHAAEEGWKAEENGLLMRLIERLKIAKKPTLVFPFR